MGRDELLLEQVLADRYGVSKTPVREALRLLVHDGLLLVLPRKGYVVRPVGLQDVVEVFELRRIIEPPLCAEAARRRTPELVEQMRESVTIERGLAAPSLDEMDQSLKLHRIIAAATGNSRAMTVVGSLLDEAARLPWLGLMLREGPGRAGRAIAERHHEERSPLDAVHGRFRARSRHVAVVSPIACPA